MIENLPAYVSITFILTTFLTAGIFLYAIKRADSRSLKTRILIFLILLWLVSQTVLAVTGFYLKTDAFPPRLPFFGIFPTLLLIFTLFIFARKDFVEPLPLKVLTVLQVIRIPVELVLLWLFQAGQVPQLMTFEGRNFDVLSGLTAPIVFWLFAAAKSIVLF